MTEQKARKRAIRQRMAKTGERYTAARRHVIKAKSEPAMRPRVADPGMSDESIRRGTGKGWDQWLRILDEWGAARRSHPEIARYLSEEQGVGGWWAQSVTVGYERARGMRARYQRPGGGFELNVSKTFPVGVDRLFHAVADPRQRTRWLEPGTLRVRTTQPGKSARFDFRDGRSRVHAFFTEKSSNKATVSLQHERLPDADAVSGMRTFWKERLARLGEMLRK